MRNVPIIDATGIRTLEEVEKECTGRHTKLIIAEINNDSVMEELKKSRLLFKIGKANVVPTMEEAISRSEHIISEIA